MARRNGISLSLRTTQVGNELFWTVLPSTSLLATVSDLSADQLKRGVRDLNTKGFVEIHELGCLLPSVPLVRLTESGMDQFDATEVERSWRGRDGLGNLVLYDFAKLEAVNAIAPFYATGGWVLWQIHWYEQEPMIAAAEYRHPHYYDPAYLVFCWASMMDTQRELFEKLEALREAMPAQAMNPTDPFWLAGLALVAASEWGAARALCMARAVLSGWVESRRITGWYYGSGGWQVSDAVSARTGEPPEGIHPLLHLVDRLRPSMSTRKLGLRKLENVLARSLWAGRGGHKLVELLTLVAIYPCGSVAQYRYLMGEKPGGKETKKRLKLLEKLRLVEVVTKHGRAKRPKRWRKDIPVTLSKRGQGAHRYSATLSGRVHFCYVHGGRPVDLFRRTKLGSLNTVVREKVLLYLLTLSWMVHFFCASGVRPVDLSDLDKLARHWKQLREGALVHLLTLSCMVYFFYAHGRRPVDLFRLTGMARIWTQLRENIVEDRWLYQHEDIVYEILGQVREKGCAFAPGWQATTTLAHTGIINPDGKLLVETPWGRLWCYLEVELSDRTYRAVQPRCNKYGSEDRRDNLPVLVACRDDQAERNFHLAAAAAALPPRMLTTTLSRLKEGGFFGPGVWSDYGRPVTLAP